MPTTNGTFNTRTAMEIEMAKPAYLVTDMNLNAFDADGMPREIKTEAAAIKKAKAVLVTASGAEVWIWKLSHVVSVSEPDVEKVK